MILKNFLGIVIIERDNLLKRSLLVAHFKSPVSNSTILSGKKERIISSHVLPLSCRRFGDLAPLTVSCVSSQPG